MSLGTKVGTVMVAAASAAMAPAKDMTLRGSSATQALTAAADAVNEVIQVTEITKATGVASSGGGGILETVGVQIAGALLPAAVTGVANVVNRSCARRNATPNLQIAEILRHRAEFVSKEKITTRQLRVSTDDNVLGDPLSRGPKYMNKFYEEARKMDATSFVRMDVPPMILSLLAVFGVTPPRRIARGV